MKRYASVQAAALLAAGSVAMAALTGFEYSAAEQLVQVALAPLLFVGLQRFFTEPDRRGNICFGIVGAGLVLAYALGRRLEWLDRTGWDGLALALIAALCLGPAPAQGMLLLCRRLERLAPHPNARGVFLRSMGLILLGWLPVWLACFPCLLGYDMGSQLYQMISGHYTAHHPLLHTLLACGLFRAGELAGSITLGAFLYVLVQMACLAASMAYALSYLSSQGCPRCIRLALTAFFALAPTHQVLAVCTTKDIFFAAAALIAIVEAHRIFRAPEKLRCVRSSLPLALAVCAMCLTRNNAVMAVALWSLPLLWLIGRGWRRRLLAVLLAAVAVSSAITGGLKAVTNADSASINEMLSVPAQQISRVYQKVGTDEPAGFEALEWVPNAWRYQDLCSDRVKLHLKVQRDGELIGFLKFWGREAFHYPIEYIDAFLLNTKGYWYPEDTSFARIYGDWPSKMAGALLMEQHDGYGVNFTSLLPGVRQLYQSLFVKNDYQRVPGLTALIHPSTYTWLLLCVIAWAVWRRKRTVLAVGALMLAYLATLFLGPCVLIRYCYYLMVSAPVLLAMLLLPEAKA